MVVAALWMIGCGMSRPAGPVVHERQTIERGAATHARVEIDMSAGELALKSAQRNSSRVTSISMFPT